MKHKKVNFSFLFVIFSFLLFFLTGCENFLEGAALKELITKEIKYNSSEIVNIRVFSDINAGVTIPSGDVTKRLGYEFDISYVPNNLYFFKQWKAVLKSKMSA